MTQVSKKCLICPNNFITVKAKIKIGKGKYCSKQCYYESLKGKSRPEEVKAKLRRHIPWMKGKKHSKETLRKISKAVKGRKLSDETKLKIGRSLKGTKHSKDFRKKVSLRQIGSNNSNWKGGKEYMKKGYVRVSSPNHPYLGKRKRILEHRLVMEKKIGRYLKAEEVIHHIDGNKANNHSSNLMLFPNDLEHKRHHELERKRGKDGRFEARETVY